MTDDLMGFTFTEGYSGREYREWRASDVTGDPEGWAAFRDSASRMHRSMTVLKAALDGAAL